MVVPEHLAQEEGGKGHIYHDLLEETGGRAQLSAQGKLDQWSLGGSLWLHLRSSKKASRDLGELQS